MQSIQCILCYFILDLYSTTRGLCSRCDNSITNTCTDTGALICQHVVSSTNPHLPIDPIGHGCGLSLEYETYQLRSQLGECKRREEKLNALW